MELKDYRKDYIEYVKSSAAADSEGTVLSFMKVSLDNLLDADVISDYEMCYSSGKSGRKNYRVDAYSFDDYDCSMSLFIANYSGENDIDKLIKSDANVLFERLLTFIDGVYNGKLKEQIEISTPAYDLLERLLHLKNIIRKFKLFIITDKEMSDNIYSYPSGVINEVPLEYSIWDIKRFYRMIAMGEGHEPIEIDFSMFMENGIPFLKANDVIYEHEIDLNDDKEKLGIKEEKFGCYLCVLPGSVLADIYDKYGSNLLEGNVRSFLSTKVAVNRNIRTTILSKENKQMFFAYNNGISATASKIFIEKLEDNKEYITRINNLQIVNGGQTTASLSNARFKDKADLSGIYVQMKLTEISNYELSQKIIPQISKCSNSQNKVSDADFFSNHEFNVRMQQASRRIYAPAVNGAQYETHWYYERSRGQYEQDQAKMTKSEQAKFKLLNPKEQKITKTDLAKVRNSWQGYPHYVSMGAQKNFSKFAESIVKVWETREENFNELYFRQTASLSIIFKFIDKMVSKQLWYEKGYKANIVTYTMSYFHFLLEEKYPNYVLNLKLIWDKQGIPKDIENELIGLSKVIFEHITDESREIKNVTEWCKKEECWKLLKAKKFDLDKNIALYLIEKNVEKTYQREGKFDQKFINAVAAQTEIIQFGQSYWERLLTWGKNKKMLSNIEESFLMAATKLDYGRIPSEKQSQRILNIQKRLIEEGFS